ncbi:transposase domain-containing protein [Streptomyces sp. NPDC099050]|uniref:transposase domain-containing protein n=1 Tax=Streptomyces sp. NPDC099050 TaxID=3366100 RepID=UPI003826E865
MLVSRLERLGLGILTRSCPPELVDQVVGEAGCGEKRRRLLSARFTVYFVLTPPCSHPAPPRSLQRN